MNNEYEREIDLLDLIFFVLEKWKLYILVGAAALIVLAGYKYNATEQGRAKNEALIAEGREDEVINAKAYQSALDALDEKKRQIRKLEEQVTGKQTDITNYNNSISNHSDTITTYKETLGLLNNEKEEVVRKLEELQVYMDQSVLLNIDATAKPVAKKGYQVVYSGGGAEELFRDPVDEILAAYTQNISLIDADSGLAEKYNIPEKFFDELFSVWYDATSNMIFIHATGTDEQMAEDVRSAVCKIIEDRKQGMASRYHAHTLKNISEEYVNIVDEGLANTQSSRYSMVNSYNSQIASYDAQILNTNTSIDNINATITSLEQQIRDANESIREDQEDILKIKREIIDDNLEEIVEAKAPSRMRSIKDGIKFGIIGAIVAAFLVAVVYCVIYIADGKIHTAADVCVTYCIPLLAVLNRPVEKKGCFIDQWIYRMRNKGYATPNDEIMKTAAVTVTKLIGEAKRIAVLSSLDAASLENVTSDLKELVSGVEFVPVADSFSSAVSAKELNEVDAVIFYEKREASRISEFEVELGQTKLLEKGIVGGIIA